MSEKTNNTNKVSAENIFKLVGVNKDTIKKFESEVSDYSQQLDGVIKKIKERSKVFNEIEKEEKIKQEAALEVENVQVDASETTAVVIEPVAQDKVEEKVQTEVQAVVEVEVSAVSNEEVQKPKTSAEKQGFIATDQSGYNKRPQNPRNNPQQPSNNQGARNNAQQGQRPYNNRPDGQRPDFQNRNNNNNNRPGGQYNNRPTGQFNNRPAGAGVAVAKPDMTLDKNKKIDTAKKKPVAKKTTVDEKKGMSKKALIQKGYIETGYSEDRLGRAFKSKKARKAEAIQTVKIEKAVVQTKVFPIKILSEKIGVTAAEIVKKLFKEGIIKTVNEVIDYETAALLCADLNIELELREAETAEEVLEKFQDTENNQNLQKRPPVVTVMGHVDHGKTSLLDRIRKSNVTKGEAGGITQHIGAYMVSLRGENITFIDTPGHEAFTEMRSRGAQVTDIAVLVVAADDGIMPQTIESISHAKAAKVPVIVAITKMDKATANVDKIKQQLTDHDLVPEEWGGETIVVPVSAHTGEGIEQLLDTILLLAEVNELKANPEASAKGVVIEARLDKGKGPIASVLVNNGTLNIGDIIVCGVSSGKVRAMINDKGQNITKATPSMAVSILGFSDVPSTGDTFSVVSDERMAKSLISEREERQRALNENSSSRMSLDEMFNKISEGQLKKLNVIVKADVQGSVEAVKQALVKLNNEEVKISIIHGGVGAVSESDVMLAQTTDSIIVCFNVRPNANAMSIADKSGIDIRYYRIIYDAIDDIKNAMKGMLDPKFREKIIGHAEVRNTFKASGVGTIAGCYVTDGIMQRNAKVRLLRNGVVLYEGDVSSLKRFKDDVKEVKTSFECGITLEKFNDIKEADVFEAYILEQY